MGNKLFFIVNTHAGHGKIKTKLADIIDIFIEAGYEVTIRTTQKQNDAAEYISSCGANFDRIIVSGGDGTFHEAVNGFMSIYEPLRPVLGYLPTGTVNDFAKGMDLPKYLLPAAKVAVSSDEPFLCDVGKFNEEYFSYVAAFGDVINVAYDTPQSSKSILGRTAYILEGLKIIPNLQSYYTSIDYDDGHIEGNFILGLISNAVSIGGMNLNLKETDLLNDGLFEVILVKKANNIVDISRLINTIITKNFEDESIVFFRTSKLVVKTEKAVPWTLDGENGGSISEAKISICNKALKIMKNNHSK